MLIKLAQQISNDESLIIILVYVGRRWVVVGCYACAGLLFTGKQMLQTNIIYVGKNQFVFMISRRFAVIIIFTAFNI